MPTDKPTAPAVARAAQLLDTLAASPRSFTDLVRTLGLPKSSVHGLCQTLLDLNLIQRLDGGQLALGPHVMRWADAFLSRIDITQEFFAAWDDMRVLPEETITLSVLDGTEVIYIACRNGNRPLGVTFRTGMRLPAVYTATGKAMLMTRPPESLGEVAAGGWPAPLTAQGPRDLDALRAELQAMRQNGYSEDTGGVRDGMYCFGAPVFDSRQAEAVAGVAVSLLTAEVDAATRARAGDAMRRLANRLSERLGAARRT